VIDVTNIVDAFARGRAMSAEWAFTETRWAGRNLSMVLLASLPRREARLYTSTRDMFTKLQKYSCNDEIRRYEM